MGNSGIVYVAFGEDYFRAAIDGAQIGSTHTDLPIHIITDSKSSVDFGSKNITVQSVEFPTNRIDAENHTCSCGRQATNQSSLFGNKWLCEWHWKGVACRMVRTNMLDYTPFENTLALDADSLIQNRGVELFIDLLQDADFAGVNTYVIDIGKTMPRIYRSAMLHLGARCPLTMWSGACWAIRNSKQSREFINKWHECWTYLCSIGNIRDMPALASAVQTTDFNLVEFPRNFFGHYDYSPEYTVQHSYYGSKPHYWERFNIPRPEPNAPQMTAGDWDSVTENDP